MSPSSSRAVATITGTSLTARSILSSSRPSTSGRPRSRTTASGRSSMTWLSPASPVAAARTSWPRSRSARSRDSLILASSSINASRGTTETVQPPPRATCAGEALQGRPHRADRTKASRPGNVCVTGALLPSGTWVTSSTPTSTPAGSRAPGTRCSGTTGIRGRRTGPCSRPFSRCPEPTSTNAAPPGTGASGTRASPSSLSGEERPVPARPRAADHLAPTSGRSSSAASPSGSAPSRRSSPTSTARARSSPTASCPAGWSRRRPTSTGPRTGSSRPTACGSTSRASTWCATATAASACSRTTCAPRPASAT